MHAPDESDSARGRERLRGNSGRVGWPESRRAAYRRKAKGALTKLVMLTRIGARLTVLTFAVLSAVPRKMRSRVLGNDYCEHLRSVSGSLLAIGYLRPMQVLSSGVLLAICAGLLEVIQLRSRPDLKRRRLRRHCDWRVDPSLDHGRRQTGSRTQVYCFL